MKSATKQHLLLTFIVCSILIYSPVQAQQSIRPSVQEQIRLLQQAKRARTPAQNKIDSQLLMAIKKSRRDPLLRFLPKWQSRIKVAADGTVLVDITAKITPSLLQQLTFSRARIMAQFPRYRMIRARLSLNQLEPLASLPEVITIRPAMRLQRRKINTTEGDIAHAADLARSQYGVDGRGIKIGVLSDGVDELARLQASGDLPANVTVLPGQAGNGSEGTAMLEIVHDLAPGASLYFATAGPNTAGFAANILALRALGCQVIVDDIFYYIQPVFQDGVVSQAVDVAVNNGALYFSAVGNDGNYNDGTHSVWEGDFVPLPIVGGALDGEIAHDFGGGIYYNTLSRDPDWINLWWSDPLLRSSNDYDLYLLDPTLSGILAFSDNVQDGTQDPLEYIDSGVTNDQNNQLVIVNYQNKAQPRFLHLCTFSGQLQLGTPGYAFGHPCAQGAFAVGAVDVAHAAGNRFTGGPANPLEIFSSDGPRRIFFLQDGRPVTPGNFLATGGLVRQKPDISAADGVKTATTGYNPFYGTSAAAPHAAAIAALMLAVNNKLNRQRMEEIFKQTALDIEAPGYDRDSGYGIVDALGALKAAAALPAPFDLIAPANGSFVHNVVTFEWERTTSPNGGAIVYYLFISKDRPDFHGTTPIRVTACLNLPQRPRSYYAGLVLLLAALMGLLPFYKERRLHIYKQRTLRMILLMLMISVCMSACNRGSSAGASDEQTGSSSTATTVRYTTVLEANSIYFWKVEAEATNGQRRSSDTWRFLTLDKSTK